jgi:hypothetical protein
VERSVFGQLVDPEPWRVVLPPVVFEDLSSWVRGQAIDLAHRYWLTDGQSGSYVAGVWVHHHGGRLREEILKLVPPELGESESYGLELARSNSPPDFLSRHLVPILSTERMGGSGWWLQRQEVAQHDLERMVQLRMLLGDPCIAQHCRTIVTSVVNEWQRDFDLRPQEWTLYEFLGHALHAAAMAGLAGFASSADLSLDRPAATVRIPGRHDELPNPFAILARVLGGHRKVTTFVGQGAPDLTVDNIMVVVNPRVDVSLYRLLDYGGFQIDLPLPRGPMKLLLSFAECWLPDLREHGPLRSSLAELLVAPGSTPEDMRTSAYRPVVEAIHGAGASWTRGRITAPAWVPQNLMVLIASALRMVAQTRLSLADRWFFFEVAAIASRELLDLDGTPAHPESSPQPQAGGDQPLFTGPVPGLTPRIRFLGSTKVVICRGIGGDWHDLADLVEVPVPSRRRFRVGDEARDLWEWLEVRGRLAELGPALLKIDRSDLARFLGE